MIRKNIKPRIKEYFFINPTAKMRVRQIERTLKLPLPSIIRYCKELNEEKILKIIKTGGVVLYTSNRGDEKFLLEKKIFNIKSLYYSKLVEHLKQKFHNPVIILFGSYSKGEDIENSDIDLYIETTKKNIELDKFEKILNRKVHLLIHKNIKKIKNPYLANNISNGIVLNGFWEIFK